MRTAGITPLACILLIFTVGASAAELTRGLLSTDVPSGVLLNPGPQLSGLHRHDGSGDAPRVTTGLWRQMIFELNKASLDKDAWPSPRDLQARALAATPTHVVPVTVLDAFYERLPAETVSGEAVHREDLERGRVFAAAALREDVYQGADLELAFDSSWCAGPLPADLEIDADDGLGWRKVRDGRIDVRYASTGEAMIRLRGIAQDGVKKEARFPLRIAALAAPAPDDTLHIQATVDYAGVYASGSAYVYLADGHTALTSPVIVVEGFDLDDTMAWEELYTLLNQEGLIETLRADGFDAVVLDFDSATEPIQRNAFVLTELITQVKAVLPPNRTTAVVGASMGGLVSRFALSWLEDQGVDPGVRTWISFDSPQRGADIPLGLQHWLEFFQDESESAAYLLSRLDTPAARQMLLLHHDATGGSDVGPDPLRPLFVQHLESVGLPSCRRVAVANGSGAVTDQGFSPGAQLIRYEYYSLLLDLKGNVWATPDGPTIRIFQGEQNVIWPLPDTYEDIYAGGAIPWDGAPGGWRSSMAQMDTTSVPYGDIEALHDHHCFIPTISSLDLDVTDPFHDVLGDADLLSKTSFDAVYVPTWNQEHVSITPESAVWLMDEIRLGVTAADETEVASLNDLQAWPNPFNPSVTIRFALPEASRVDLSVHDLRGRRLATLSSGRLQAGPHDVVWRGRGSDGARIAAGGYILRLETPDGVLSHRISILE